MSSINDEFYVAVNKLVAASVGTERAIEDMRRMREELAGWRAVDERREPASKVREQAVGYYRGNDPYRELIQKPRVNVDFPKFSGDYVNSWLLKANQYFVERGVKEEDKVSIASVFLEGAAYYWWRCFSYDHGSWVSWIDFERGILHRFDWRKTISVFTNSSSYEISSKTLDEVPITISYNQSSFEHNTKIENFDDKKVVSFELVNDKNCLDEICFVDGGALDHSDENLLFSETPTKCSSENLKIKTEPEKTDLSCCAKMSFSPNKRTENITNFYTDLHDSYTDMWALESPRLDQRLLRYDFLKLSALSWENRTDLWDPGKLSFYSSKPIPKNFPFLEGIGGTHTLDLPLKSRCLDQQRMSYVFLKNDGLGCKIVADSVQLGNRVFGAGNYFSLSMGIFEQLGETRTVVWPWEWKRFDNRGKSYEFSKLGITCCPENTALTLLGEISYLRSKQSPNIVNFGGELAEVYRQVLQLEFVNLGAPKFIYDCLRRADNSAVYLLIDQLCDEYPWDRVKANLEDKVYFKEGRREGTDIEGILGIEEVFIEGILGIEKVFKGIGQECNGSAWDGLYGRAPKFRVLYRVSGWRGVYRLVHDRGRRYLVGWKGVYGLPPDRGRKGFEDTCPYDIKFEDNLGDKVNFKGDGV